MSLPCPGGVVKGETSSLGWQLALTIEGATPEELDRGAAAARRIFAAARVAIPEAAAAATRRNRLDDEGVFALVEAIALLRDRGSDPAIIVAAEAELAWLQDQPGMHAWTSHEARLAALWDDADRAALEACCKEWPEGPAHARLESLNLDDGAACERAHAVRNGEWAWLDDETRLVEWLERELMGQSFVALAHDTDAEELTLADLDWYRAPTSGEEQCRQTAYAGSPEHQRSMHRERPTRAILATV